MRPRSFLCALLFLPALSAGAVADDDADKELKKFEGAWKFVSVESDGNKAPAEVIEKWRFVVKKDEATWGDPQAGDTRSRIKIDPSKSPKRVDITALEGDRKDKTLECIYKFEKNRLTICFPEGKRENAGRPRPEKFEGGEGMSLIVLEKNEEK